MFRKWLISGIVWGDWIRVFQVFFVIRWDSRCVFFCCSAPRTLFLEDSDKKLKMGANQAMKEKCNKNQL